MTALNKKKNERVDIRVSAEEKHMILEAAKFSGEKMSDFILSRIMPDVERLIATQTRIRLGEESWNAFVEMLQSPKPAPKKLKEAMKEYRKAKGG
jgi:uncharacterized protein (DUF1778 family)